MKKVFTIGRISLGLAYLIYGYLHFTNTAADASLVPDGIGSKTFWVIFIGICWWAVALSFFTNVLTRLSGILASVVLASILCFTILPHFNHPGSWLSIGSICSVIGGSLMVSSMGTMWPSGFLKAKADR